MSSRHCPSCTCHPIDEVALINDVALLCEIEAMPVEVIRSRNQTQRVAAVRHRIIGAFTAMHPEIPQAVIGRLFGRKGSTVFHSLAVAREIEVRKLVWKYRCATEVAA